MRVTWLIMAASVLSGAAVNDLLHEFHVTNGRMAIEGTVAMCEVRFFKHDLEDAVAQFHERPDFRLAAGPFEDSLFVAYLNSTFEVRLNGAVEAPQLVGSGEEIVREEEMWWYRFSYEAPETIARLDVKDRLLFDLYDDQRNILKVQHFPSGRSATYYFVPDSDRRTIGFPSE